ncbi:MAG: hypothetical protein V3T72_18660, partial [Thermoanaerobaculia bacterium]
QQTVALEWVLARPQELRLDEVENELACLELVWCHLYRYWMLFGYLWKNSRRTGGPRTTTGLSRLAAEWDEWATAAEAEMGGGLSDVVHGELRAQLIHRVWPTWLPIASTISRVARQSEPVGERLDELVQAAVTRSPREHVGNSQAARLDPR